MNLRTLEPVEIASLAARTNVRKVAVVNFLSSMGPVAEDATANLQLDTRLYRWNAATQRAIRDGIRLALFPVDAKKIPGWEGEK